MRIAAIAMAMMLAGVIYGNGRQNIPFKKTQQISTSTSQEASKKANQIKMTIALGGAPYEPAKDTFHVGESIPLVISMTNTSNQAIYVCESGTIYQDRPQLLRNGQPVPYSSFRKSIIPTAEKDNVCQTENLPQQVLLPPKESQVVDWFNLAQGVTSLYEDGWYERLPVGKYTLTDWRRLNCCDGPSIESNTISFVIVL